jgi:2-iminobutanoate/2-iminopropanoate deaminase
LPRKRIETREAPPPIGPYSQAVVAGNFLFSSGQIPLDPATGEMVVGEIEAQTEQVLRNIDAVLRAANLTAESVVKTTVFLVDLAEFPRMNAAYAVYFGANPPSRSTVGVAALPRGARVEIEVVASY